MLKDKIALVTGGSRGIGSSICTELAKAGATVIINYSNSKDSAEEVLKQIESASGNGEVIKFEKKFFLIIGIGINTAYSPKNRSFKCISLQETSDKLISNIDILLKLKKNYETIFYNYKYNKKLLKA